ncbi:MAG: DNA gyrase inhibitor YacG [Hyphomicrobiales bacterium]
MADAESAKSEKSSKPVRLRPRRPCPICQKASVNKFHPFCSKRCADIDLHRWLGGQYAIPAEDPVDFEDVERQLGAGDGGSEPG